MEDLDLLQAGELKKNKSNQIYLFSLKYIALNVTEKVSFKWYTSAIFIFQ
jgi:hypothetical protein